MLCAQINTHSENERERARGWNGERERDDVGFSCSYFKHTCYELVLIKCVRTPSHSIAIAQIQPKAFMLSTFCVSFFLRSFRVMLFFVCLLLFSFFMFQWKKTATFAIVNCDLHTHTPNHTYIRMQKRPVLQLCVLFYF